MTRAASPDNIFNPKEDEECFAFSDWLKLNNIPHTHVANESGSNSQEAKRRGAKLKRMGLSSGVWDYDIFVPIKGIDNTVDCYQELRVEMKKRHGGVVSPEQKEWGKIYELTGTPCKVCKGADEAIKFVNGYLKNNDDGYIF